MANLTVARPLSFWSRSDPIQQPQPFADHWAKMKMRAMASASGGRQCNVASCASSSCGGHSCACICHHSVPPAAQPDTDNMALFMSGIQRSRTEPNLATHPAVTVRKYLLANEAGDPKGAMGAPCYQVPSGSMSNALPWVNDPNFAKCCGPQMWFGRKPPSVPAEKLRTSYQERARSGFKYWFQDRPKPTRYGCYSIGAKYTQMGLGFAPRS